MTKLYSRAIVPAYIPRMAWDSRDAEYAPWIIGHEDFDQLDNSALDEKYDEWKATTNEEEFSEFVEFLEKNGYVVSHVENPGVWSPQE